MNTIIKKIMLLIALLSCLYNGYAQTENPVISAIQVEVDRNKANLKMERMPAPFFISYTVIDRYDYNLSASLGTINSYNENHQRNGVPTLLIGDYLRNNLKLPERPFYSGSTTLFDNTPGLALSIWKDLDGIYKNNVEMYQTKMAVLQQQTQTAEEKNLPDFEQVKPVNIILQPIAVNFNKSYWENYLRKVSETAKQFPDILNSSVSFSLRNTMSYTYNTEGSRYAVPNTFYQLVFNAKVRADDGQDISFTIYEENATFEQMSDLATFTDKCKSLMENLIKLKNAPVVDDAYSGPVLFEGRALYNLFAQVFLNSNRLAAAPKLVQMPGQAGYVIINGVPQMASSQSSGNDFELMLNKKVISRDLTIKSITGQEFYKGQRLNGYYAVDAEGVVPDKELALIENGVLRNLLNGRKPTLKIGNSNGHVRYDFNNYSSRVIAGNLLFTCKQTYPYSDLRKKLIDAAKDEDLDYAYVVKEMSDGANCFYKVYVADGREELVRGATISDGSSLKPFKRVLGASDKEQIQSYGAIQTTIIYPDALLFEEMDVTLTPNIEFKKPYIVAKP